MQTALSRILVGRRSGEDGLHGSGRIRESLILFLLGEERRRECQTQGEGYQSIVHNVVLSKRKVNREPKLGNGDSWPVEWMPFQAGVLYTDCVASCDLNTCWRRLFREVISSSTSGRHDVDSAFQISANGRGCVGEDACELEANGDRGFNVLGYWRQRALRPRKAEDCNSRSRFPHRRMPKRLPAACS